MYFNQQQGGLKVQDSYSRRSSANSGSSDHRNTLTSQRNGEDDVDYDSDDYHSRRDSQGSVTSSTRKKQRRKSPSVRTHSQGSSSYAPASPSPRLSRDIELVDKPRSRSRASSADSAGSRSSRHSRKSGSMTTSRQDEPGVSRKQHRGGRRSKPNSVYEETLTAMSLTSIDEAGDNVIPDDDVIPLEEFTLDEKMHLENILQRIEQSERIEIERKSRLNRGLEVSLKRVDSKYKSRRSNGSNAGLFRKYCDLCGNSVFMIFSNGIFCTFCDRHICKNDTVQLPNKPPLCQLCVKQFNIEAMSGEWFLALCRERKSQLYFAPDILRASLRVERRRLVAAEKHRQEMLKEQAKLAVAMETSSSKGGFFGKKKKTSSGDLSVSTDSLHSDWTKQQQQQNRRGQLDETSLKKFHSNENMSSIPDVDGEDGNSEADRKIHLGGALAMSRESVVSDALSEDIIDSKVGVTGEIQLTLDYEYKKNAFTIIVHQCMNLTRPKDVEEPSAYVKTYLLPDISKNGKRKTAVVKKDTNPRWGKKLSPYIIHKSDLDTRTLRVSVWHHESLKRNLFLGEVRIRFDDYRFGDTTAKWYPLEMHRNVSVPPSTLLYHGDMVLSIKYSTHDKQTVTTLDEVDNGVTELSGSLHIWIRSCKNLVINGTKDNSVKTYVISSLYDLAQPERQPQTQKSRSQKSLNPAYNCHQVFKNITPADLQASSLELEVIQQNKFSSNDFLGMVRLNLGICPTENTRNWKPATGYELMMWQAMIKKQNTWIDGVLLLKPHKN